MAWVQRNGGGKIVGVYALRQMGVADEQIADSDASVVAFKNPPPDPRIAVMKADVSREALLDRLRTATPAQIDTYVAANVTTLAQARDMMGTILKLIALDARQ